VPGRSVWASSSYTAAGRFSRDEQPTAVLGKSRAGSCCEGFQELQVIEMAAAHLMYLGCKQRFHDAVNDHIGLEPDAPS
jgi:hypothetical protein